MKKTKRLARFICLGHRELSFVRSFG